MIQFILVICLTGVLLVTPILLKLFIMRPRKSKTDPDSTSSDETSESEAEEMVGIDKSLDTDAVNPLDRRQHSVNLTISDVKDIQENLDDYEKISLIFLLSDKPQDCLDRCELVEWVGLEMIKRNSWEEKLWEALAIIKNFQIPKKYGFSKEYLIGEYFPFQYFTAKHVSKFKKVLYLICEHLNEANEKLFIQQLKKDFNKRNLRLIELSQMEMYFSFLLKIKYISAENIQKFSRIAKTLNMEYVYDLLKFIDEDNAKSANEYKKSKPKLDREYSNSTTNYSSGDEMNYDEQSVANSDSTQDNEPIESSPKDDDCYNMEGHKICLIMDQENFYTEVDPEYEHLLPATIKEDKLHTRYGTKEDSKRLKRVFETRKFQVKIVRNQTHLNMIKILEKFVAGIDRRTCSCFFVIILSHGNTDVVYGTNSCYVEISRIINIMAGKNCIEIPKILVLQACQGSSLLKHFDENLATDCGAAAVEPSDPKCPNFMLFSSTVPGFASIRDKTTGTWFIQSFCDQLQQYADKEHFVEICTRITNDVAKNKWRRCQMIPYLRLTLYKKLYI